MSFIDLKLKFGALIADPTIMESCAGSICDELVNEMILEQVFKVHHDSKCGILDLIHGETADAMEVEHDLETAGQQFAVKKVPHCFCPNCNRTLSASRFAPHLERCMGMGRNSSRIASQRIANNIKENVYGSSSEEDDDDDWIASSEKAKSCKLVSELDKSVRPTNESPKSKKIQKVRSVKM